LKSNLTFGDAKIQVAQQASKQNTSEFLTRAGTAIQKAVQYWNRYNWRWLMKQAPDVTLAANENTIAVPYDFKDVYDIRVESNGRNHVLVNTNRRLYDRLINDQSAAGEPAGYDLFSADGQNKITITPVSNADTTIRMRYYRRMWVPCVVPAIKTSWLWEFGKTIDNQDKSLVQVDNWKHSHESSNTVSYGGAVDGYSVMSGVTLGSPLSSMTVAYATAGQAYASASVGIKSNIDYPIYSGFSTSTGNASGAASSTIIVIDGAYIAAGNGEIFTGDSAYVPVTINFGGDDLVLDMPVDFEDGILARATSHFLAGLGAPEGRLGYFMQKAEDELQEARRLNEENEDQDVSFEVGAPPPPIGRFRSNGWV
jgi:hypothetical protein